jgi:hypothetical protein
MPPVDDHKTQFRHNSMSDAHEHTAPASLPARVEVQPAVAPSSREAADQPAASTASSRLLLDEDEELLSHTTPSIGSMLPFGPVDALMHDSNGLGGPPLAPPHADEVGDPDDEDDDSSLNEVDDAPRASIIHLDESDEEMQPPPALPPSPPHATRPSSNRRAATAATAPPPATTTVNVAPASEDDECDEDDEPDDTAYCYCRTKWTGEMMVSCDQCLQWYHAGSSSQPHKQHHFHTRCCLSCSLFVGMCCVAIVVFADCMGIPDDTDMTGEEFHCDACRIKSGMPLNSFPNPRRDRRAELAAAAAAASSAASPASKKARQGGRKRALSQRQREALEATPDPSLRGRDQIENAQKRAKAKAARRAAEKSEGLSKAQRAAKRAKERAAREQERSLKKARAEKEAKAGGLKSLVASFDESSDDDDTSSSDSSDSDESDDSSSSEDEKPSRTAVQVSPAKSVRPTPAATNAKKPTLNAAARTTKPVAGAKGASLQAMAWEPIRAKVRHCIRDILCTFFLLTTSGDHSAGLCHSLCPSCRTSSAWSCCALRVLALSSSVLLTVADTMDGIWRGGCATVPQLVARPPLSGVGPAPRIESSSRESEHARTHAPRLLMQRTHRKLMRQVCKEVHRAGKFQRAAVLSALPVTF